MVVWPTRRDRRWLALSWLAYLLPLVAFALLPSASAATAWSQLFIPLLVLTSWLAPWWLGASLWAALLVAFASLGQSIDINLDFAFGHIGPALGGFLFGLPFLALGRALRLGYDFARRAGRAEADAAAAKERERQISLLLRGAAHEIANPLSPIRLQMSVVIKDPGIPATGKLRDGVARIDRSVRRLERLVLEFQESARSLSGELQMEPTDADLAPLLRELAEEVAHDMAEHRLEWTTDLPASLPCRCDTGRILQATLNLCQNAVRYTPEGGRVRLRAAREGGDVVIAITDTGVGLTPEQAAQLFQPMVRLHPEKAKGVGLGLWLTRGILKAHGGRAEVQSAGPGFGSTFTLRWPASSGAAPAVTIPAMPLAQAAPGPAGR